MTKCVTKSYAGLIFLIVIVALLLSIVRCVREIAKSDYKHRNLCPSAWSNWAPTERISMKFDT